MKFINNISNVLSDETVYHAAIINGLLEIETIMYFSNKNFKYLVFPEINDQPFANEHVISFERENKQISLNSSQAMRVSAASSVYDKVFTLSRSFRNEHENDGVHLSAFKMLEVEFKSEKEEEIFSIIESYFSHMINWFNNYIRENKLTHIFNEVHTRFPIEKKSFDSIYDEISVGRDKPYFDTFTFIDNEITKYISQPTIITYYPSIGAWRSLKKDETHSYLYNLILPDGYGELFEFSIRENDYKFYYERFKENNTLEYFKWYLDAIEYDKKRHAGFGMGIERLGSWLMKLENIDKQLLFSCLPNGGDLNVKL